MSDDSILHNQTDETIRCLGGSFEELAKALACVEVGLWEYDIQAGRLRLSETGCRVTDLRCAEIDRIVLVMAKVREREQPLFAKGLQDLFQDGRSLDFDLPIQGADGAIHWSQIRGRRFERDDGRLVCRGTFHDVTRLREHDAAASDGAERYRLLVENTHDLVAEITVDGRYCYVNPSQERILGRTADDVLGTSALALIHPEDLPRILEHFQVGHGKDSYRFRHKDGSWRWLESTGTRFRTCSGEDRGVVISRDITDRKRAEEEKARLESHLRHAQKMEAIGTLAGGIAHDFNNILGVIIAYTELAQLDLPDDSPVQPSLSQVMGAGLRAKDLVQQILAFSRQQRIERRPIRLDEPLTDALALFRSSQQRPLEIATELQGDTPAVLADSGQIRQVVLNLCSNAALALPETGGRIDVRLDRVDGRNDPRGGLGPMDYARITVRDTGCGMDSNTVKRVFDPFFTTRGDGTGTGLGLSVVHGVVKSHGGVVRVDSVPGQGSTFEVFLPRFSGDFVN